MKTPDKIDILKSFWVEKVGVAPDHTFHPITLDPSPMIKLECKESGFECPLHEKLKSSPPQYLVGAYAFWQDEAGELPIVMYCGKAVRLRTRLAQHWASSKFINDWFDDFDIFSPLVSVWLTDTPTIIEAKLISTFKPRYNRRRE